PSQSVAEEITAAQIATIVPVYAVAVTPAPLKLALAGGASQDVTFTVENRGTEADVMTVEILPNPWSGAPQPAPDGRWTASGGRWLVSLGPKERSTVKVPVTPPAGATGDNPLTVKAASGAAPLMTDTATVRVAAGSADLALAMTAPATLALGSPLKYQTTITNRGPNEARDVRVTQQLPAGVTVQSAVLPGGTCIVSSPVVCSRPLLAASEVATLSVTIVPAAAGAAASSAQVGSALLDPVSYNDTASATTQVYGKPVISAAIVQKGTGSVTVRITNTGTAAAQRVAIEQVTARTTGGTGTVAITPPPLPVQLSTLAPGGYRDVAIGFTASSTVKSFSITESGSFADPQGTVYRFAVSQGVIP
ncbi:MAG: hypothetical protein NTW28_09605, partial [Candidatus Solibacter sp.]|nr:hypothetical protein [Candidatus Solibacter sp.]